MDAHQKPKPALPEVTYSVNYGCAGWNASDDSLTRSEAWLIFYRYCQRLPMLGDVIADYVNIQDDSTGIVLEAYAPGRGLLKTWGKRNDDGTKKVD